MEDSVVDDKNFVDEGVEECLAQEQEDFDHSSLTLLEGREEREDRRSRKETSSVW